MDIFFIMNSLAGGKKGLRECKFQKGLKTRLPCPSPSPRGCSCPLSRWKVKVLVTQSCLTPCDPMHCSSPGSSVHGILQARILEWVAMPSSRGSF